MKINYDPNFRCEYCGESFGNNPMKLAVHIAKLHVEVRIMK